MENANDLNVGSTGSDATSSDAGTSSTQVASASSTPGGQGGTQTDPRDAQIAQYKQNLSALNKALVDARRSGRQQGSGNTNPSLDLSTPEAQYAISLELGEGRLRSNLESIFELYPEVPAAEVAMIRKNPFAYASRDSYVNVDTEAAKLEIEQYLLSRVEELSVKQTPTAGQATPPAQVNANPSPDQVTGEAEGEDLWSMPMQDLEKKVAKLRAQKSLQ